MKLSNKKIINNSYNKCCFKDSVRIHYNRENNLIYFKPCSGSTPINANIFSYDSDYFINNFDECLLNYENNIKTSLLTYYNGICIIDNYNYNRLCLCKLNKIKFIQNCISRNCNLKCIMCTESKGLNKKEEYLYKKVNDLILQSNYCKKFLYIYEPTCSGEPFLYKNEIYKMVDSYIKNIHITTNGTLINDTDINILSKYKNKIKIALSFDSIIEKEYNLIRGDGNYKKVLSNINKLKYAGLLENIQLCINEININSYKETINYFKNKNIKVLVTADAAIYHKYRNDIFIETEKLL